VTDDGLAQDRARLLELLTRQSFAQREVVLSSGRRSDFYIDCKRTMLTAEGHYLVGRLLLAAIREHLPQAAAIGGLTLGADPLASAVSLTSHLALHPLPAFIVRKEPKGHGTGQWIEGREAIPEGATVAVLEDVVTTGGSSLKAVERVRAAGFQAPMAFALVDRLEGGREALQAQGVTLHPLFTRRDFLP